jgi:hypothetical protein
MFELRSVTGVFFAEALKFLITGHQLLPDGLGRGAHGRVTSLLKCLPHKASTPAFAVQAKPSLNPLVAASFEKTAPENAKPPTLDGLGAQNLNRCYRDY